MKHHIKIIYLLSMYSVRSAIRSYFGSMLFILGKLLRFGMFFLFVFALVSRSSVLRGYSAEQAIIVLMTFELLGSISGMLFREVYRFRPLVVSGGLDGILTKPHNTLIRILFGGFDILDAFVLVIQVGILGYLVWLGHYSLSAIVLYCALVLNGLVILGGWHIFALSFGLLTTSVDQVLWILRDLTDTGRFPIEIYKQPAQFILTFILPVGVIMTFPSKALFGMLSWWGVLGATGIAIVSVYGHLWLWNYALKKYQSWGG